MRTTIILCSNELNYGLSATSNCLTVLHEDIEKFTLIGTYRQGLFMTLLLFMFIIYLCFPSAFMSINFD